MFYFQGPLPKRLTAVPPEVTHFYEVSKAFKACFLTFVINEANGTICRILLSSKEEVVRTDQLLMVPDSEKHSI